MSRVLEVRQLPLEERRCKEAGNVIIDTGIVDVNGYPEGVVFFAKDVKDITWKGNTCIITHKLGEVIIAIYGGQNEV